MRYIYFSILSLLFISLLPAFTQEQLGLNIVYPKNNARVNAPSVFFVGGTNPNAKLKINGNDVNVYPNGGFVQVVPLNRGNNTINIESTLKDKVKKLAYTISVPEYEKTIPNFPLKIDKSSIKPDQNITYQPGDIINLKFKGSTGNKASFSIGNRKDIPMVELNPEYSKADIVFGKAFDTSKSPVKGIYSGSYKIQEADIFKNTPIIIKLASEDDNITEAADATVTVIPKNFTPMVAEVVKDYSIVRNAPGKSRLTPLSVGTRINVTGRIGDEYRFKMGNIMEGWISVNDINILPEGAPVAESIIGSVNIESVNDSVLIKVPLSQKLPVSIEQLSNSQISLSIYGGISDVSLIPYNNSEAFIKEIKSTQPFKDVFQIVITPNAKQLWGYDYYYEDNTFILKLRKPPFIDINNPLKDKTITIDPGHGGTELGSVGPTGVPEKTINLEIAKFLKQELENNGAKVIMTRNTDKNVGLYERIKIANDANSLILLSIHNNALPDGRDPYKEHGSSTYYYHSQALPLTKSIQKSLVQNLGLKDFGIFWDSLALTRPHKPIAVLVEIGFMINPDEYTLLTDQKFQEKSAKAIYMGLEDFLKTYK
ncbi:MAG: hypothetical protein A2287_03525 [Candidatus Melainabacteria bacterium RIFOXYA12_FULL_32_12]|nr:MAG: hypothetical protein A2255_08680 [Candidatus Melainabacteria bacterium RIFOXYA2_FULL_32_9]OGI28518.1 MAG: hypothetical protein A2287_03525 [Candidatus Melainabacteria bacterium RIFOXYA12_FULL_32_12]